MDNSELTTEQTSEVVHFLKSWGIDDPILLAEMTDHYSDKALDMISKGKSLEQVLNSWRTKSMFRTLREIDAKYKDYAKKDWRRKHWTIFKELITPRNIFIFLVGFIATYFILKMKYVSSVFLGLVILKAIAIVGFVFYQYNIKNLKRRLYNETTIGLLWFGNFYLIYFFVRQLFDFAEPVAATTAQAVIIASIICIIFVSDIVFFRVWNYISQTTGHITREMLTEWEIPKPE